MGAWGWMGAAGLAAAGGALGYRLSQPDSQLLGRTLVAGDDPNEWALTYDDGPHERWTPELLELLDRAGVRATFFMIGEHVRQRPALARAVLAAGHVVGNHTMHHPFLATKSARLIREEIGGCQRALEDALGQPVRFFRAPHGARRPVVGRICRELGLEPVQWNTQGNDWEPLGVEGILARLERDLVRVRRAGRGANLLLHDGSQAGVDADRADTVRATARLLDRAAAEGRRWVTVEAWDRRTSRLG